MVCQLYFQNNTFYNIYPFSTLFPSPMSHQKSLKYRSYIFFTLSFNFKKYEKYWKSIFVWSHPVQWYIRILRKVGHWKPIPWVWGGILTHTLLITKTPLAFTQKASHGAGSQALTLLSCWLPGPADISTPSAKAAPTLLPSQVERWLSKQINCSGPNTDLLHLCG